MKSVIASMLVLSLVAGCTAANKKAGYVTGGALAAGGGVLFMTAAMTDCSALHNDDVLGNGTGCDVGSGLKGGMGLLAAAVGLGIVIASAAAPDVEEPKPAIRQTLDPQTVQYTATLPPVVPPTNDATLRNFTQQASMAARTGQCIAVRAIAKRVEDLDREYRHNGFLTDPLVVACL